MNRTNKAKYPMIAALLSSKVLKEKRGRESEFNFDAGLICVRGHETMNCDLDVLTDRLHVFIEGVDMEIETISEPNALLWLFEKTLESSRAFARTFIIDRLSKVSPTLALNFSQQIQ